MASQKPFLLRIRANFNGNPTRNKKVRFKKNSTQTPSKYHKTRFDSKFAFLRKFLY